MSCFGHPRGRLDEPVVRVVVSEEPDLRAGVEDRPARTVRPHEQGRDVPRRQRQNGIVDAGGPARPERTRRSLPQPPVVVYPPQTVAPVRQELRGLDVLVERRPVRRVREPAAPVREDEVLCMASGAGVRNGDCVRRRPRQRVQRVAPRVGPAVVLANVRPSVASRVDLPVTVGIVQLSDCRDVSRQLGPRGVARERRQGDAPFVPHVARRVGAPVELRVARVELVHSQPAALVGPLDDAAPRIGVRPHVAQHQLAGIPRRDERPHAGPTPRRDPVPLAVQGYLLLMYYGLRHSQFSRSRPRCPLPGRGPLCVSIRLVARS